MFQLVRPDRVKYTLSYTYTYNRVLKSIHIHIKLNIMKKAIFLLLLIVALHYTIN